MRYEFVLRVSLLFTLIAGMIFAAQRADTNASSDLESVTLQLNWNRQFELAGFIAAKEKGFYRDAGLDVHFRLYRPGMDVVKEVLNGKADYGLYSSKLLKRFIQGEPLVLIASFFKKPSMFLVAKSGIKDPQDLQGKIVMVPFSRQDFRLTFGDMFANSDINISSIKLSRKKYSLDAFINGKVDAIVIFLPSQLYRLGTLSAPYTIINPGDYSDLTFQQDLFTSQKFAKKYPDRTLAFRNASVKGWDYALKHPYEIIEIIRKKYAPHLSFEELSYQYRIVKGLIQADLYPIGSIDKKLLLLKLQESLKENGGGDANASLRRYLFGGGAETSPLILSKKEREYLRRHPIIRAHNESSWPPFNFNENGQARGFCIDYFNLLAKKIGVRVEYISGYTWYEFLKMINTDKIDVINNIAITKERKKYVRFTHPFINLRHAIYTRIDNQVYYSLKELAGKRVALVKGFFIQQYLKKHYPKIKQVLVPNQLQALKMLSFAKVDAVIGKQVVVDYLMRKYLISNIIATDYVKDPGTISHVALGVGKENETLARILSKAQETVTAEEFDRLKHKWFGINKLLNSKELLDDIERRYLQEHRDISVCIRKDRAPIEFFEKAKAQGISVEILNTLARRFHLNLHFLAVSNIDEALEALKNRRCDIMAATSRDGKSDKLLYFTKPYLTFDEVLIAPIDKRERLKETILNGRLIAARRGDEALARLKRSHSDLRVLEYDSYADIFQALRVAKADYALMSRPVFEYQKRLRGISDLDIVGVAPAKAFLSIGVRKDRVILYNILNKVLNAMPKETYYAISQKWASERILKEIDWKAVFLLTAVSLLIIFIILAAYVRQRRLSHKIKELNETLEERIEEALEKNREQELFMLQQDRLAKMGELIAMIAHQWRQPLNNLSILIQMHISRYKKGRLDDEALRYFQKNATKQIRQMSDTIEDFRNFYKTGKSVEEFCVNDTIKELIHLSKMSFSAKDIKLYFDAEGIYYYTSRPNELSHAILNIMNNAKEAFCERDEVIGDRQIRLSLSHSKEGIILEICDNAGGIPEEIMEKIFDPYFSTKRERNGSGLGLYMTRVMIVEHMGSLISVRNSKEGACFTITLKGKWRMEGSE